MNIVQALNLTWFVADSFDQIPPAHLAEFMREVHYTNFSRCKAVAGLGLIISLSLLYLIDITHYRVIPTAPSQAEF